MADVQARDRSRSPRGDKDSAAAADGANTGVPAHWMTPAAAKPANAAAEADSTTEADSTPAAAPTTKGRGKGKGKKSAEAKPAEDVITPGDILSMAGRVENGDTDISPEKLGQFLRKAAAHVGVLE